MPAYYNEFDRQKAAWLRKLIRVGAIAPGDVDERSIKEIHPNDLKGYTQCHFFAGIGVWSYALREAGWPDDREVWTGSCPCQSFSVAGQRKGFADERHLWPEWFRLIEKRKPRVVFGEQSASKDALVWLDLVSSDLEKARYACGAVDICACGFGVPHLRKRLYFVAQSARERRNGRSGSEHSEPSQLGRLAIADRDSFGDVADASSGGRGKLRDAAQSRSGRHADREGLAGHVGNAPLDGREVRSVLHGEHDRQGPRQGREPGHLGNARGEGLSLRECEAVLGTGRRPEGRAVEQPGRAHGELADACRGQLPEPLGRSQERNGHGPDSANHTGAPGPVNGFWRNADWIYCRDDKWRAVEAGTFPLAHGTPHRVGRLRGYGDGLVAPQAIAFIEAYLES